jgi:hypothetical protein
MLSPEAVAFAAQNAQTLPEEMRRYIAESVEVQLLPDQIDWVLLLSSTTVPPDERLAELLQDLRPRRWEVANALWKLHPERCIAWATNPQHPNQEHFLERCPDKHVANVARALTDEPGLWVALKVYAGWATQRLARPEAQCKELHSLLATQQA